MIIYHTRTLKYTSLTISNIFSLAYNELNLPRKRFLNCHHVLFWLLKKNGFHPNEEDFKLLILPQKRAEQEKIIQTIFKKYNWKENGVPK